MGSDVSGGTAFELTVVDQIALEVGGERTAEVERARSAWTWCYLYDRTIDESAVYRMSSC